MSDKKCCECGCKTFEKKSFAWDTCTKCETVWTLSEMIHERKVLEIELSETKDYLNAIFQIMKPLIPACPMTMRKMWAKAMDDGKKIRSEATQQFEELQLQRDRLQQRNKEHEMFRHQHRDCNEMSIDNQKLRAEKKRYREVLVEALSIAEQSIDDPDTVLIEHLKQALQEKI